MGCVLQVFGAGRVLCHRSLHTGKSDQTLLSSSGTENTRFPVVFLTLTKATFTPQVHFMPTIEIDEGSSFFPETSNPIPRHVVVIKDVAIFCLANRNQALDVRA